jgi:hypothetical protein
VLYIQHGCVGALNQDALALLVCIVQAVHSVCKRRGVQCRVDLAFGAYVTQGRAASVHVG